jgi:hypothetical protein
MTAPVTLPKTNKMILIGKLLVLALTAAASPILRRDAVTLQNDITQRIVPQYTSLKNDSRAFPASGLPGASAIRSDFQDLTATVNSAISEIQNTAPFCALSGFAILADVRQFMPASLKCKRLA